MSGVKLSAAELEAMRLAELERQRLERLRQIKVATDRYNDIQNQCEALRINVSLSMKKELQNFGSVNELQLACKSFVSVKASIDSGITRLTMPELPVEPKDIQALNAKLQSGLTDLENIYGKGLSEFAGRLSVYSAGMSELAKTNEFSAALSKIEREKRLEYCDLNFDLSSVLTENTDTDADMTALYDELIEECTALVNNGSISQENKRQLLGIINELQKNQEDKTAADNAVYQYKVLRGSVKKNIRVFNDLYAQYSALHTEWRGMLKNSKNPVSPMLPKHKIESVKALEEEIQLLDGKIRTENKHAYIREQIDDVMRLFGYNVAESIVLSGTTKGQHYLFESDRKAIHLFMSDSNSVMFEPVGLDNLEGNEHAGYDAIAAESISDADRAAIYEDQKDFCELHPKMVEELRKRGVLLNHKNIKEANIETVKLLKIKGKHNKRKRTENQEEQRRYTEQKSRVIKND
jgi:hypothetical protein